MGRTTTTADYSLLLLSVDDKVIPFTTAEWGTAPSPQASPDSSPSSSPARRHSSSSTESGRWRWTTITDPKLSEAITAKAISLFRENQCQHGTNLVVRIDLHHLPNANSYTSTSITRVPDLGWQTTALVATTIPGGNTGMAHLLGALEMRNAVEKDCSADTRLQSAIDSVVNDKFGTVNIVNQSGKDLNAICEGMT